MRLRLDPAALAVTVTGLADSVTLTGTAAAERLQSSAAPQIILLGLAGDDTIAARIALWEEVNREDREKLERLQIALGSAHAVSGPLAEDDYEGTIRDFQLWLAAQEHPPQHSAI